MHRCQERKKHHSIALCTSCTKHQLASAPMHPRKIRCSLCQGGNLVSVYFFPPNWNKWTSLAPNGYNIPIPSSSSSPHPLATASSSSALLSTTLTVSPPVSTSAGCSESAAVEVPGTGANHVTSICPTVGRFVPLAYPFCRRLGSHQGVSIE